MDEKHNGFVFRTLAMPGEVLGVIERLFDVAKPEAVYSKPAEVGEFTVITASELLVSMGAGYGGGSADAPINNIDESIDENQNVSTGGGGGGGGFSMGRPVAAITIGPHGMYVEPIVDPTKIAIAFFTSLVAIAMAITQMERFKRS